jgi:predicted NBD/HSP70 family sugar kinase
MTRKAQSSRTSISETAREHDDRAIGIDVGGTHLRAALISGRRGVLRRLVEPTPTSPADTLDTAARMARQILETCPEEITTSGIAVAATLAGAQVSWSSQPALDNEHIGHAPRRSNRPARDADQ